MNVSTRYTVALHILTLLALDESRPMTSDFIAGSVNTNPVVIRRLLGKLRNYGLAVSHPGVNGGWLIAKPASTITLADVRMAMEEGSPFTMHSQPPNPKCPVGRSIQGVLSGVFQDAEQAMCGNLSNTTIAGLLDAVKNKNSG
jgi:Rrf2 family protein